MRPITTTIACALASLMLAVPAQADLVVGVSDDTPKGTADGGASFYAQMSEVGLKENRITVPWDPDNPSAIKDKGELDRAIANAAAAGIKVVFAVYPSKARGITSSPFAAAQFTNYLASLAQAYPQVKDFIVGNEPNQPRFWQPQFNPGGSAAACGAYQALLGASYDVLKATDPSITVVGVGLSPRGNDEAKATSNASTSPVRCLRDIGAAYRASRRDRPIMDELSFHPFPDSPSDALMKGYLWPKAGVPNLDRIKQAVWDAFFGTAQPTFAEGVFNQAARPANGRPLMFRLNEVGWQVEIPPGSAGAYFGRESPGLQVTDEASQAQIYAAAIPILACDPSVKSLLFFHLIDDPDLDRWQSGLVRADGSHRASYDTVKATIARTGGRCAGTPIAWRHAPKLIGPSARFPAAKKRPKNWRVWQFVATAFEDAPYKAGIFRVPRKKGLPATTRAAITRTLRTARPGSKGLLIAGKVQAYRERIVRFRGKTLKPGYYVYGIRLAAEMNPARATQFVSAPFQVGVPAKTKKKK